MAPFASLVSSLFCQACKTTALWLALNKGQVVNVTRAHASLSYGPSNANTLLAQKPMGFLLHQAYSKRSIHGQYTTSAEFLQCRGSAADWHGCRALSIYSENSARSPRITIRGCSEERWIVIQREQHEFSYLVVSTRT
jgi:hypothetical protein